MKEIKITQENENQRLDKFLLKILKETTSSFVYKMLRKKNITLNDKKASGNEKLLKGDVVKIFFSDETYDKLTGSASTSDDFTQLSELKGKIDIIYEDDNMIIINKPTGLLSQKAESNDISVNELAISYMINSGSLSKDSYQQFHPSVVNRLDRNTSGIIVFAKTLASAQRLSAIFKDRSCKKMYRAIVKGKIDSDIKLHSYLTKDEVTNKVTVHDNYVEGSKEIKTNIHPLQYLDNDCTYIEIHLITGKTHQIRAHLSSIGHPIAGDNKYGGKMAGIRNQLLHAYSLTIDNEEYIAPLPKEFNIGNLQI